MSRQAKTSVLGLYQWNNNLFSLMSIPEGLELDIFVNNPLAETSELELLYPNYEVMKVLIGSWSSKCLPIWQHLYDTTQYEYDPIENYSRTEVETINIDGSRTHSGTDTTTHGGTNSHNDTTTDNGSGNEYIAGFDSVASGNNDGLVKQGKSDATNTRTNNGSETFGKTETLAHGEHIETDSDSTRENHTSGNIGVTTTQKMIREEREIAEFNIYDRMIRDFINRFCIEVY